MKVTDFNLDKIYLASTPAYNNYVKGFLVSAIPKFTQCNQKLSQRDDTTQVFNIVLTDLEQEILASMMVVEWCSKEVHSIMELRRFLNDTDFKMFSESQNLREKKDLLITTRESTDKLITQYGYATLDFSLLGGS
jgi:hypothetical protein